LAFVEFDSVPITITGRGEDALAVIAVRAEAGICACIGRDVASAV
jgi:hypothetical protein